MQFQYIKSEQALNDFLRQAEQAEFIAIDTEFVRTRTLKPQLGLVQMYDGQQVALIDPLSFDSLEPLWRFLRAPSPLKVIHACSEDLEVFNTQMGAMPATLFDTQIALSYLGEGLSLGYAAAVKQYLDVELDKSEARTDWMARPLTQTQCEYAAADVLYLWQLYQKILPQVEGAGIAAKVLADVERIFDKKQRCIPHEAQYLNVKDAWRLKRRELAVLKVLAAWRQQEAEKRNLALSFVVKNPLLMSLAQRRPATLNSMRNIPGMDGRVVGRYGKTLLGLIEQGKAVEDESCPELVKRVSEIAGYKAIFEQLKAEVEEIASETQVPVEVVASKKQLNELITYAWELPQKALLGEGLPELLRGWRGEYFAPLAEILKQKRSA